MSNRRKLPRRQSPVDALIASLDGARLPGGCDSCDAWHTVSAYGIGGVIHHIRVYHDASCPLLAAHAARKAGQ